MANYTANTWTTGDTITKTKIDRLEAGAAAALPSADAPELIRDTMAETVHTIAASGTAQTLNPTVTGPYKRVTLTGNCTFTFAGTTSGQVTRMDVELVQDATGGRTVTWPTVKWVGGSVPVNPTPAGSVSVYTFWHNDTSWFGAPVGLGFA